ncbi:hypothetical protein [Aeromicrobium fastidiosum]|uniref:hypothetical protein n=1 Tax=Aeromicrobium fastidiosum TaxID=52699 RepID=UPI00165FB680|nr:hypothetical protein [Aeromicrobium fastidiosum]MBP2390068.1 hypothetical protein [Aeromicrobium fastidiosum]
MSQVFTVIAAVWGISGAAVAILFALDERSHRRSQHATSHTRAEARGHVDGALA